MINDPNSTHHIYACTLEEIEIRAKELETQYKNQNPSEQVNINIYPKPDTVDFDGFVCHKFEVDILAKPKQI